MPAAHVSMAFPTYTPRFEPNKYGLHAKMLGRGALDTLRPNASEDEEVQRKVRGALCRKAASGCKFVTPGAPSRRFVRATDFLIGPGGTVPQAIMVGETWLSCLDLQAKFRITLPFIFQLRDYFVRC